jgi:acyl-CoA dehydrogenase
MAERTLDEMVARVTNPSRRTFGQILARHGTVAADVAKIRIDINAARLMVLAAADKIDKVGAKGALRDIAMAKVMVPNVLQRTIDLAIQAFGAAGLSQDYPMARFFAAARSIRIADGKVAFSTYLMVAVLDIFFVSKDGTRLLLLGPDEVHIQQLARFELIRGDEIREKHDAVKARRKEILANNSKL